MRDPARILVADDTPANVRMLETRLAREGYEVCVARDGEETLAIAREAKPDLILLDIMMPKLDGIEVCRRLKGDASLPFTPIIMVTALTDTKDVVAGLEAGGDDYLTKPMDAQALLARVKSMLRIKSLHDTVKAQALELERWNATLEERVKAQLAELERISRNVRDGVNLTAQQARPRQAQRRIELHEQFADCRCAEVITLVSLERDLTRRDCHRLERSSTYDCVTRPLFGHRNVEILDEERGRTGERDDEGMRAGGI